MNKKICAVTSTRADYSLLKPLIEQICKEPSMDLILIVTGSHLSEDFGNTYEAIEKDGFHIYRKINILADNSKQGVCNAMGLSCFGYAEVFESTKPDLLILLGDRYEIFTAAGAATVFNIPIAHIHGGEVTTGAIDNVFRHSITQMSELHFTAAQEYQNRVKQMLPDAKNVFFTGSLAVDSVKSVLSFSTEETSKAIGVDFSKKTILFTYHPETVSNLSVTEQVNEVLWALEQFQDVNIVMTKANTDVGGTYINRRMEEFASSRTETIVVRDSLGQKLYYSAMRYASAVVGNSSSGILETPIFKTPAVNIGKRQNGRITAANVISCPCEGRDIELAIHTALSGDFKEIAANAVNPFEREDTVVKILLEIKKFFA